MGNEQSREAVAEPAEASEASASFDPDHLTSDDETQKEEPTAVKPQAEEPLTEMARKKKPVKKRQKPQNDGTRSESPEIRLGSEEIAERMSVMRQKEPEMFGEYAVSEESNILEDDQAPFPDRKRHLLGKPQKAWSENETDEHVEDTIMEDQFNEESSQRLEDNDATQEEEPDTMEAETITQPSAANSNSISQTSVGSTQSVVVAATSQMVPDPGKETANHLIASQELVSGPTNGGNPEITSTAESEAEEDERVPDSLEPPKDAMDHNAEESQNAQDFQLSTSSGQQSASPEAVFDNSENSNTAQVTPRLQMSTKRKRPLDDNSATRSTMRKRARNDVYSPPTSENPSDLDKDGSDADTIPEGQSPTRKQTKLKSESATTKGTTGKIDTWAKKYVPGSNLKHPLLNPSTEQVRAQRVVEVNIPTNAASSSKSAKAPVGTQDGGWVTGSVRDVLDLTQVSSSRSKKQKTVYTSPKGKGRAQPGVNYSSPAKEEHEVAEAEESSADDDEETGIATSTARRTFPRVPETKNPKRASNTASDNKKSRSLSVKQANVSDADEESEETEYLCRICSRPFETKAQRRKHERRATHSNLSECDRCGQGFYSVDRLAEHQRSENHGSGTGYTGRTGAFDQTEIRKIHKWRDQFCEEHDIDQVLFNEMMTNTCRRNQPWPYKMISKGDFLDQYFDVLPGRNKKSMRRYRERHFQNASGHGNWTEEDDEQLGELVDELGPKWVEIGLRMTRTQDAVTQRWRNVVQYAGKRKDGEWTRWETDRLRSIVAQVKGSVGLALNRNTDGKVPWREVSRRLGEQRTPQQCSNRWRVMNCKKKSGKYVPKSGQEIDAVPGTSSKKMSSKMEQRLAGDSSPGARPPSRRSEPVSEEYVKASDSEANNDAEEEVADEGSRGRSDSLADQLTAAAEQASGVDEDENEQVQSEADPDAELELPTTPNLNTKVNIRTPTTKAGMDDDSQPNQVDGVAQKAADISQIFAQTQANTSAIRAPPQSKQLPSQERPSPNLSLRHRPVSSPTPGAHSDTDQEMFDAIETGAEVDRDQPQAQDESQVDTNVAQSSEEEAEPRTEAEVSTQTGSASNTSDEDDEDDTGADSEEGSETRSESEAESHDEGKDDANKVRPWSTVNDFMNSIKESASKSSQLKPTQTRKRKSVSPADDDSDDD